MTIEIQDGNKKLRAGLKLIRMMKMDINTAKESGTPLVIEGEALDALLTVIDIAEKSTLEAMAPILDPTGKVVQ